MSPKTRQIIILFLSIIALAGPQIAGLFLQDGWLTYAKIIGLVGGIAGFLQTAFQDSITSLSSKRSSRGDSGGGARGIVTGAIIAVMVTTYMGIGLAGGCAAVPTIVQDVGNIAACTIKEAYSGPAVTPQDIVNACKGAALADVFQILDELLATQTSPAMIERLARLGAKVVRTPDAGLPPVAAEGGAR